MKKRNTIYTWLVLTLFIGFAACGSKPEQSQHGGHAEMNEADKPIADKGMDHSGHASDGQSVDIADDQAEKILNAYLELKDALVETNSTGASNAASNLISVIGASAGDLAGMIRKNAENIANAKGVKEQRNHFNALSNDIYTMARATDAADAPLYRQYCPMAMNNNGAYWLSREEEIRNPYFGESMLTCGKVQDVLR